MTEKFKVGDRVQFKEWDEMVEEFGVDNRGDIKCTCFFTVEMNHLCGRQATISKIDDKFVNLAGLDVPYRDYYSTDMLKLLKHKAKPLLRKVKSMTLSEARQYLAHVCEYWVAFGKSHKIFIKAIKKVLEDKNQLVESYEKQIKELQTENAELKARLNPKTLYGIETGKVEKLVNVKVEYHFDIKSSALGGWIEANELGKYAFLKESEAKKAIKKVLEDKNQ